MPAFEQRSEQPALEPATASCAIAAGAAALRRARAAALAAALLAGCSARPLPPWEPPAITTPNVPAPVAAPSGSMSAYVGQLRRMNGDELTTEYGKLLLEPDEGARLRQALVLASPNYPLRDEQRAQQQVDEILHNASVKQSLRDDAALVGLWLEEIRRGDDERRRAQAKSRDDEARIQQLETRAREQERRAAEAEKKLEALRSIERELSSRSNGRVP